MRPTRDLKKSKPTCLAELAGDRERGAGHDHRRHFVEQLLAHRGADVDRRGGERESRHAAAALVRFDPVDGARLRLRAPRFELAGERHQPVVGGDEILLLGFLAEFLAGRLQLPGQQFQLGAEWLATMPGSCTRSGRDVLGSPRCRACVDGRSDCASREVGEELVGQVAAAVDLLLLLA